MKQTFFGLGPNYRPSLYDEVFKLIHFGKGFGYSEVMNMPTWLRRFFLRKIIEVNEKRAEMQGAEITRRAASKPSFIQGPKFNRS